MHAEPDLGDPRPNAPRAAWLRARLGERLADSYDELLRAVGRGLERDLTPLAARIRSEPRLPPAIFVEHERLAAAVLADDAAAATAAVERLLDLPDPAWRGARARIGADVALPWVQGALGYLQVSAEADTMEGYVQVRALAAPDGPRAELAAALEVLGAVDPAMRAELDEYVTDIVVVDGENLTGASSIQFFGAILLHAAYGDQPALGYYLDHLVHEASHHHLYSVLLLDPLVQNDPAEMFPSPLRKDQRPMLGLYHGLFVLGRVLRTFRLAAQHDVHPFFAARIPALQRAFDVAHATIDRSGRLTPIGRCIVEQLVACNDG